MSVIALGNCESIKAVIDSMYAELALARELYRPSAFWEFFNDKNLDHLRRCGVEHFKRTINQNYYNWLPTDFAEKQLLRLLDHWRASPTLKPLRARLDDTSHVETVVDNHALNTADKR